MTRGNSETLQFAASKSSFLNHELSIALTDVTVSWIFSNSKYLNGTWFSPCLEYTSSFINFSSRALHIVKPTICMPFQRLHQDVTVKLRPLELSRATQETCSINNLSIRLSPPVYPQRTTLGLQNVKTDYSRSSGKLMGQSKNLFRQKIEPTFIKNRHKFVITVFWYNFLHCYLIDNAKPDPRMPLNSE